MKNHGDVIALIKEFGRNFHAERFQEKEDIENFKKLEDSALLEAYEGYLLSLAYIVMNKEKDNEKGIQLLQKRIYFCRQEIKSRNEGQQLVPRVK